MKKIIQSTTLSILVTCLLILFYCWSNQDSIKDDKIAGMFYASAIADAMAGPHEGRSTEVSQQFLRDGNWINSFSDYTPWHQHHWNVYQKNAEAGTFTDDDRMRLAMVKFMIKYFNTAGSTPITRRFLAEQIVAQYREALTEFKRIDEIFIQAANINQKNRIGSLRKERFLHLWFYWELAKTATAVYIPADPPIYSPPYIRVSDDSAHPDYSLNWHLAPVDPKPVTQNIKNQYHKNSYAAGLELPLGLIFLLPAASYFPGQPAQAFRHVLQIDFFDIGNAPYYPAVMCALIADALGGKSWLEIENSITEEGLTAYLDTTENSQIAFIESRIKRAIKIAGKFRGEKTFNRKKKVIQFIIDLHREFAANAPFMCTVEEMLFVPIALVAYSPEDINFLIELGVNYGRDNDTAGSIAAMLGGALAGSKKIRADWKRRVEKANPESDIANLSDGLANIVNSVHSHKIE